jgi:predicted transcriptional regulator
MRLEQELTENSIITMAKQCKALGNPKHLQILLILENRPQTLDEIHEKLQKKRIFLHRESTYKAIEKMVDVELIKKEYDQKKKKFFYSIL